MTSTRSMFPVIDTGILLVLNQGVGPVRSFRGPLQEAIWLESGCHGLTGDLGIVARLGFGVRGFGPSAAMPIFRSGLRTRLMGIAAVGRQPRTPKPRRATMPKSPVRPW